MRAPMHTPPPHTYVHPLSLPPREPAVKVTTGFTSQVPFMSVMCHLLTPFTVDPGDGTATTCSIADCCIGEEGHNKTHWLSKTLLEVTCTMLLVCR